MDQGQGQKTKISTQKYYNIEPVQYGSKNTTILNRLERDIAQLQIDIKCIKDDVSLIKEYIKLKQKREDAKWF